MAVNSGKHAVSEIAEYIGKVDVKLMGDPKAIRKVCKSVALTGALIPYVEALPQGRWRYMFFVAWALPDLASDRWQHLLTLEESNERVVGERPETTRWVE
jgi:hypothetical protein